MDSCCFCSGPSSRSFRQVAHQLSETTRVLRLPLIFCARLQPASSSIAAAAASSTPRNMSQHNQSAQPSIQRRIACGSRPSPSAARITAAIKVMRSGAPRRYRDSGSRDQTMIAGSVNATRERSTSAISQATRQILHGSIRSPTTRSSETSQSCSAIGPRPRTARKTRSSVHSRSGLPGRRSRRRSVGPPHCA